MKNYRLGIHEKQLFYGNEYVIHGIIYKDKDKLIESKCKIDNYDQKNGINVRNI